MTSLVPRPIRAVQVTSEGLEPNFPDKLDRWRHIQNRLKTGNKALKWQLSTGSLGTKRKLKQQKGAHSLPAHCQLFPGRKRCSPKNSSTYSGTRKSPLKRRSSFVYLVSVRKDPFLMNSLSEMRIWVSPYRDTVKEIGSQIEVVIFHGFRRPG